MDHVGTASQAVQAGAKPGCSGLGRYDNLREWLFTKISPPEHSNPSVLLWGTPR